MDSWGIDDAVFWWGLGLAFLLAVCAYNWAQTDHSQPAPHGGPSLDPDAAVYELAYLNGGPHLTITAAAARLHQDAAADAAGELERSLLGALHEAPAGTRAFDVRNRLATSDELRRLDARLIDRGLLREPRKASMEHWSVIACFAMITLANIRFAADADISLTRELVLDAVFVGAMVCLACVGATHRLTEQGRTLLDARRMSASGLRTPHADSDLSLAVALFGGGVLWHADPAFAATWGVPREDGTTGRPAAPDGCGGGSCGAVHQGNASCG